MAVRMMCDKSKAGQPNVERVDDYPGAEVWRVQHHYDCPHRNDQAFLRVKAPDCNAGCRNFDPLFMETTWVGCVVSLGEHNHYDDSDFFAMVWDDSAGMLREVEYATTRGWSYPNGASVDATPEVLSKVEAWRQSVRDAANARREAEKAAFPSRGKRVRVVRGRKLAHGLEGEVFWIGPNKFDRSARYRNPLAEAMGFHEFDKGRFRVGIRFLDGTKEFTAASNVDVVAADECEVGA